LTGGREKGEKDRALYRLLPSEGDCSRLFGVKALADVKGLQRGSENAVRSGPPYHLVYLGKRISTNTGLVGKIEENNQCRHPHLRKGALLSVCEKGGCWEAKTNRPRTQIGGRVKNKIPTGGDLWVGDQPCDVYKGG